MNDNLLSWLLSTGLNEQRSKLYLAILSRGTASAKELAEDLKLNRTAIYDNLRILKKRGYVSLIHEGKRKLFVALHPKELYKKINGQRQQLKDLLPDFLAHYAESSKQPFVTVFKGKFAAREVFEDIIKIAKDEYIYFSPSELAFQMVDEKYIKKWIERRVNKKIRSRSLRVKSKQLINESIFNDENQYLRQIKYLPTYVDLRASIYIYKNNIGMISTKREGAAYIIHSPDLSFSLKQIFEFLWSVSE